MKSNEVHVDGDDEIDAWNQLATAGWDYSTEQFWFHSELLYPAIQKLLERSAPGRVLDFGCGPGHLISYLAGARIACEGYDPATRMARRAREISGATVYTDIEEISRGIYDSVVANVVLSAVSDLRSVIGSIAELLADHGGLVMSVPHPVFALLDDVHTTTERSWTNPEDGREGVWRYLTRPVQTVGWGDGLPPTALYHRTLSDYSSALADCGFLITDVIEPIPAETSVTSSPGLYDIFSNIPGFLIIAARQARAATTDVMANATP